MRNSNPDLNHEDDDEGEEALAAPTIKIRVYLRGSKLLHSIVGQEPDTQCLVSLQSDPTTGEETEVVSKNSNPKFTTYFPFEYEYGTKLLIFVHVYASDTKIGMKKSASELRLLQSVFYDVQDILGTHNTTKARRLRKGGTIYAYIESNYNSTNPRRISDSDNDNNSQILSLRLKALSLVYNNSRFVTSAMRKSPDTYFEVSRQSASSEWIVVYRSPTVLESITPMWDEAMIDLHPMRSSSVAASEDLKSYPILISIYKVKKKKCKEIGSFETSIQSLIEHGDSAFVLQPKSVKGVQSNERTGEITVVSAAIQRPNEVRQRSQRLLAQNILESSGNSFNNLCLEDRPTSQSSSGPSNFSDYVQKGLDIDLCVAIDFTSSNGDIRIPGTLHYSRDGMSNDYADSIESICSAVENCSKGNEFTVWGFGAKFDDQVRHIFQCGQTPTVSGTQGVLDAYRSVFESDLIMSGPTHVKSVINAAAAKAKRIHGDSSKQLRYTVLLVLTDGVVNDLEASRQFLSKFRHLPLSVVIVGIGRADFSKMNQWNEQPLEHRGRFTFVEFRPLQFDLAALSGKALERVPQEIVDYFNST